MFDFKRLVVVEIIKSTGETIRIDGLRVDFEATKTDKIEANSGIVSIFNLSDDTRAKIDNSKFIRVWIGYENSENLAVVLFSEISKIQHSKNALDIVTTISCTDGKTVLNDMYISKSYANKTSKKIILEDILKDTGLKILNPKILSKLEGQENYGTSVNGCVKDIISDLIKDTDLKVSIQNNSVLVDSFASTIGQKFLISEYSGMIGTPTLNGDIATVECVIFSDLNIACQVELYSRFVSGIFKIKNLKILGSNFGNDWKMQLECERFKK